MRASERDAQFAAVIGQYRDALYRLCCGYVRAEADRQDIFQEVLIHIWKSLSTFRGQSSLGTWLYRIAVNTCLGWLRREKRRSRMLERADDEQAAAVAAREPQSPAAAWDEVHLLYACIAQLPPVDRLLVSLHLEELDAATIATVLGISEGNVRVKLHRIKNQLRELWERQIHEPR